jgi:hypothetical protein
MIVTGEVDGYRALPAFLAAITCRANSARILRFSTSAKLYVYETILRWPPENFKDMSFAISGSTSELASLTHDGL